MSKAPWKVASDKAVRDRVRRLPKDTAVTREAKRLVKEDNDTLGALEVLLIGGYIEGAHYKAHQRWLDAHNRSPEDFA